MIEQRFSIGFRCGEFPGKFNTDSLFFLKKISTILDLWQRARCCWTPKASVNFFHLWEQPILQKFDVLK